MGFQKDIKTQNIFNDILYLKIYQHKIYILLICKKNYTFSNQTRKGCNLVPVLCIISPAVAHYNLVLGNTLTFTVS